jgi:hypothetical protein
MKEPEMVLPTTSSTSNVAVPTPSSSVLPQLMPLE